MEQLQFNIDDKKTADLRSNILGMGDYAEQINRTPLDRL